MPIRIVNEVGNGYKTRIFDAETGEDLTTKLSVLSIRIDDIRPNEMVTARIDVAPEKVDITVAEAEIRQVCPYCGHETKKDGE